MEFWKEIRRQVLTKELSQRAAMKRYGLGWHTLKKILTHAEPPGYRQSKARRKRKLEPFLPIIHQILEDDHQAPKKQRHTAQRIFDRLRQEHGYPGGLTVVKDVVRAWKQTQQEVFLPLSHPPGEAQADFGEATICLAGQETKVALFVMTLPYSGALLERKPGGIDYARPLENWHLPEYFALLRRRLEAADPQRGTRSYIRVLRLLEKFSLTQLTEAVEYALDIDVIDADSIRTIVEHRQDEPAELFPLDGRPQLAHVRVETTDVSSYQALLEEVTS